MHIEVKKDGQWMHYSAPSILRDALFFDLISGLYGKTTPIVNPRGLPNDMSPMTQYCYTLDAERCGVHHEGWLNSNELLELQKRLIELRPGMSTLESDLEESYFHCYICGNAVASHEGFEDSRFIFWFDN